VADPLVQQIFPWAPLPPEGSIVTVAAGHVALALGGAIAIALLAGCAPAARASLAPALASLRGGRG
jgi:ABC-type lipoprotein release transport system permease subunit